MLPPAHPGEACISLAPSNLFSFVSFLIEDLMPIQSGWEILTSEIAEL